MGYHRAYRTNIKDRNGQPRVKNQFIKLFKKRVIFKARERDGWEGGVVGENWGK